MSVPLQVCWNAVSDAPIWYCTWEPPAKPKLGPTLDQEFLELGYEPYLQGMIFWCSICRFVECRRPKNRQIDMITCESLDIKRHPAMRFMPATSPFRTGKAEVSYYAFRMGTRIVQYRSSLAYLPQDAKL